MSSVVVSARCRARGGAAVVPPLWCFLLLAAAMLSVPSTVVAAFDAGRAPFKVYADGAAIPYRVFSMSVMPGEQLQLRADAADVKVAASAGRLRRSGDGVWYWRAPDSAGHAQLTLRHSRGDEVVLTVFVLKPLDGVGERARGYRVGHYPDEPLRGHPIYLPPPGLIVVKPEMVDLRVSPHFTLGQFLCKQQPDHWPKLVALRPALLESLELILEEVNRRGIAADTLSILSGFRTPWYNAAIGNGRYSRHIWGGAADIFIDTTGNGMMDDVNADGRVDAGDARWLLDLINDLFAREDTPALPGGRGLYGPRPHRGPFVHVDARGWPAYWEFP